MMDTQQNESNEREVLTEFISLYCDLPCLWDIGSETYKDRNQKTQAWELLKDKLKEIEPEANIAAVKKKVDHMRSAFKREYKKVKESKRTGAGANDVHVPNLWYYNLLLPIFDKKNEQSRCGVDTLSSDEDSRSSEHEKGKKRKGNLLDIKKHMLIDTAQELLQSNERKDQQKKLNSFGLYVGEHLDEVETFQRQVAEKLISDILFLAKTGNLNFDTRIETTAKSRNLAFSRSPSSNISNMQQAPSYQMIHASPSICHYQTSPSPHFINQPSPSIRRSNHSSSSPQHFQMSPSPHHGQSPSPQHIQPSPSPSPNYNLQSPSSQHIQPRSSPQHIQPSSSPHYIQPSPSPSPHYIQRSSSPHFQILSQGFQQAPSPHQIQQSSLPTSSSKQHFQTSSQHMQASLSPQNSLPSTSLQTQLPSNNKNENIVQINIPSPRHSISNDTVECNDTNSIIYEGPASAISEFVIFKKNK